MGFAVTVHQLVHQKLWLASFPRIVALVVVAASSDAVFGHFGGEVLFTDLSKLTVGSSSVVMVEVFSGLDTSRTNPGAIVILISNRN